MGNTKNKVLKASFAKKYYDANREKVHNNLKEERFCECCNRTYKLYALSKHNRTDKHIRNREIYESINQDEDANRRVQQKSN